MLSAEIDDGYLYLYDADEAFYQAAAGGPDAADAILGAYGYRRCGPWRAIPGGRAEADIERQAIGRADDAGAAAGDRWRAGGPPA